MKKYFGLWAMILSVAVVSCDKDSVDDGGVTVDPVYGCTDTNAINYNVSATNDDGSCEYTNSYLLNGDWDITHLEYDTEIDLSIVDASILDAISPGLSVLVSTMAPIPVQGESEDAGSYSLNEEEATYVSDLQFTTEPITVITFEVPGLPIDLQSEGTWLLQNNDEELLFVDNTTGAEQIYEVVNLTEDFALLRGVLVISQDLPSIGTYEFEVELDLTLEK